MYERGVAFHFISTYRIWLLFDLTLFKEHTFVVIKTTRLESKDPHLQLVPVERKGQTIVSRSMSVSS